MRLKSLKMQPLRLFSWTWAFKTWKLTLETIFIKCKRFVALSKSYSTRISQTTCKAIWELILLTIFILCSLFSMKSQSKRIMEIHTSNQASRTWVCLISSANRSTTNRYKINRSQMLLFMSTTSFKTVVVSQFRKQARNRGHFLLIHQVKLTARRLPQEDRWLRTDMGQSCLRAT